MDAGLREAAEAMMAVGRDFARRGWVAATGGNFSCRLGPGSMLITRTGRDKGALEIEDFQAVPLDGALPEGLSAEAPLHRARYRADPGVGAVLHMHSPAATVASRLHAEEGRVCLAGFEMLKALDGIATHDTVLALPVLDNDQDTWALAEKAETRLAAHPAPGLVGYLVASHGLYAWGRDLALARRHVEALDFLLTCWLEARRLER